MSKWPDKEKAKVIEILTKFSIMDFAITNSIEAGVILGELYNIDTPIDPVDS